MTTRQFRKFVFLPLALATLATIAISGTSANAANLLPNRINTHDDVEWGLGISPAKLFFKAEPGDTYEGSYQAFNEGTNAFDFAIIISPAYYTSDYSGYNFNTKSKWNNIINWITIETDPIHLEPGQMVEIPFTVNVPQEALGESQFFAFINRIIPDSSQNNGAVNTIKQIGLVSSATINGSEINGCGKIIEQKANWWQSKAPLKTFATIENCGNIDFYAAGKIIVENAFFGGGLVYESSAEQLYLVPETQRDFELNWSNAPTFGIFKITQQIQVFDEPKVFEKIVILCPFWIIILIIITIYLLIIAILRSIAYRKNIRKDKKPPCR